MGQEKLEVITGQKLGRNLADFAVDRTDLKELLATLPENNTLNLTTIEYELQILRILSVGWAITFFMPVSDNNKGLATQIFWESIREISQNISTLTQTTTGKNIDYFEIIKERLNTYLKAMQNNPDETQNPAEIMGPAFAGVCKCDNDPMAILIAAKMFTLTLGAVKEYLNAIKIITSSDRDIAFVKF